MKRIDAEIEVDKYRSTHKKEYKEKCEPAEESLQYFFAMVEGE